MPDSAPFHRQVWIEKRGVHVEKMPSSKLLEGVRRVSTVFENQPKGLILMLIFLILILDDFQKLKYVIFCTNNKIQYFPA